MYKYNLTIFLMEGFFVKKILSLILSVVIMISSFSCLSVVAGAENANAVVPDGYTPIYTAEDLRNIEKDMNASYLLMNDIDLTEATGENGQYNYEGLGWMPIGSDWNGATGTRTDFNGVLDGNGHTIKGMRISISDGNPAWAQITDMYGDYHNIGLFSVVTGKVMNLNLESMDIVINCTSENTPVLQVGGISGVNDGEIIYCATSGKINIVTYPTVNVGGIFGRSFNSPTVKYCSNNANIYCESENGVFVGGTSRFRPDSGRTASKKFRTSFCSCSVFVYSLMCMLLLPSAILPHSISQTSYIC